MFLVHVAMGVVEVVIGTNNGCQTVEAVQLCGFGLLGNYSYIKTRLATVIQWHAGVQVEFLERAVQANFASQ